MNSADPRLSRVTQICASLPETTLTAMASSPSCARHPQAGTTPFVTSAPDRFYKPAHTGPRGWVGLRLDRESVDWIEAADLITESYLLLAPKRLRGPCQRKRGNLKPVPSRIL